jgi:hypothetical protein
VLAEEKSRWSHEGFHLQHWNQLFAETFIDCYSGQAVEAHRRVLERWPALQRSLVLHVQVIHIEALLLRAISALSAAAQEPARAVALLNQAERDARRIAGLDRPWANPIALLIRGLCAQQRKRPEQAVPLLRDAADGLGAANMALHAAAARYRLGEVMGGEEGATLQATTLKLLAAQDVVAPERILHILAPGRR